MVKICVKRQPDQISVFLISKWVSIVFPVLKRVEQPNKNGTIHAMTNRTVK